MKRLLCILEIACCGLAASPTVAQCTGPICRPPQASHPSVVRVVNTTPGGQSFGSGTLIETDSQKGIVLTCAHLFESGRGTITVQFADGSRSGAVVLDSDTTWDLAALQVTAPRIEAVPVAQGYPRPGESLTSCGYGPDGRFWCNRGRALGYARADGVTSYETLQLSGMARDGDSGGPVFNQRGELVAVVWGTDGKIVAGTYCGRIRRFLANLLTPVVRPGQALPLPPRLPDILPPSLPTAIAEDIEKLRQQLNSLEAADRSRGDHIGKLETAIHALESLRDRITRAEDGLGSDNLRAIAREVAVGVMADHGPGLIERAIPGVLVALGWTGPPAIAAVVGMRLAGVLLRRRLRRKRTAASTRPAPASGSSVKGGVGAGALNDDYAAQLAQVYALSGRSPLADITLGREYDEELRRAESSSDAALAAWAGKLRERVARRFHRIHSLAPAPAEPVAQTP